MNASENIRKGSRRRAIAILFLPTLPQRLTLLGIFVFVVITVTAPSYAGAAWGTALPLFFAASVFAVRGSIKRTGHWTIGLWRALAATVSVAVVGLGVILGTRFVAAGGTTGGVSHHTAFFQYVEFDLVVVTLGLLLWIPQLFFNIQLDADGKGDAQRVLLGPIAAAASVMTGIYILLLHFGGGPLGGIHMGPLIAGVFGVVLVVTPAYRSLARACWRRGVSGVFYSSSLGYDWGKALSELGKALDRASEHKIAGSSGVRLEAVATAHPDPQSGYAAQPLSREGLHAPVRDGLAVASLVLGIVWLGGIGSFLAVIFGHISNSKAKRAGRKPSGLAVAGLVLGYIGLVLIIVATIGAAIGQRS